jgi:hypothetical protein
MSDYASGDRVSIPGRDKGLFFQSSTEGNPASNSVGTRGTYPKVNPDRGVTLTTHSPVSRARINIYIYTHIHTHNDVINFLVICMHLQ